MEIQNETLRGQLIEVVSKNLLPHSFWEDIATLTPSLQTALDSNLKFETKVTDAEVKGDDWICCEVVFADENSNPRVISITVGRVRE